MNDNIHKIVNDSIVGIVANMDCFFQHGELAFLSYENKIETILKNKIAWELQKQLDFLSTKKTLSEFYLVKMEWSPEEKRKCDMAVLRQDKTNNNDYSEVIALFELKFSSLQKAEELYKREFVKDICKMVSFCKKDLHGSKNLIDIYYLFFQQLHLKPIKEYRNAFTYVKLIDSCFGKMQELEKKNETENIKKYWEDVFSKRKAKINGNDYSFDCNRVDFSMIETDLGIYFNHPSYLETAIWGPIKVSEIKQS